MRNSLPEFAAEAIEKAMPHFAKKLKGFDSDDALLTAVESRSSSPVRIPRDENYESNIKGIYPAGEEQDMRAALYQPQLMEYGQQKF